ncbi:hypothetical protein [Streptomyces sp. NPDC002990]
MDDQGGAGGVPLDEEGEEAQRRKPHTARPEAEPGPVRAADTDEASRLDRPQDPEEPRKHRSEGKGPDEY